MMKKIFTQKSKGKLIAELRTLQDRLTNLKDTERLFRYYYDNIPAYVYVKDKESNYIFINKKCEELFNVTREELIKRKYTDYDFFATDMAEKLRNNDKLIMQSGKSIETEEIGKPEGHQNFKLETGYRYYLALKFPLKDLGGNIIGVCGFSHDITKQKLLEIELQSANMKLKAALSEIKTLQGIIPICSYCHEIRDDKGAWEQMESYISKHSGAVFSHGVCPKCYDEQIRNIRSKGSE